MNKRTKKTYEFNLVFMSERRKKFNLTYQELADKTGSSKSYMYELCNLTDLEPSGSMVFVIAKALKCKMEDFYK